MRVSLLCIGLLLCTLTAWAAPMPSNTLFLGDGERGESAQVLLQAHRAHMRADLAAMKRLRDALVRRRIFSRRMALPHFDTFIVNASSAATRALPTRSTMRDGTPQLTFAYQNWTADQQSQLSTLLATVYPVFGEHLWPPHDLRHADDRAGERDG